MMRPTIATALLAVLFAAPTPAQTRSPAELLTIIADPSLGERDTTRRRFEFVLPRLVERCSDLETDVRVGDMVAALLARMEEAGLEREEGGILGLANTFYGITTSFLATAPGAVVNCSELWSIYSVLRREGTSQAEAQEFVSIGMGNLFQNLRDVTR